MFTFAKQILIIKNIKIMDKQSFRIKKLINDEIQVGDIVRVVDGSSFSAESESQELFIVFEYPKLTNSELKIKDIDFEVVQKSVSDYVCSGACGTAYLQDLVISINGKKFRTASKLVRKLSEL